MITFLVVDPYKPSFVSWHPSRHPKNPPKKSTRGSADHVRVLGNADPPRWGLAAKVAWRIIPGRTRKW